jgi:hypothetical protein
MKKYIGILIFLISIWGCGGSVSAPPGSTITMSPAEITVNDGGLTAWHTQYFTIYVKDSLGSPLGNVKLSISYPWAVPDSYGLVQFYNGSTPVNSPFDVETDDFGTYVLRVDYQAGGLDYKGDIEIRSGAAFTKAAFTVES